MTPDARAQTGIDVDLPTSAKENINLLAKFNEREEAETSRMQLSMIERISAFFGSPAYFVSVVVVLGAWALANIWVAHSGGSPLDAPPFPWLQGMVSSNAPHTD